MWACWLYYGDPSGVGAVVPRNGPRSHLALCRQASVPRPCNLARTSPLLCSVHTVLGQASGRPRGSGGDKGRIAQIRTRATPFDPTG